VTIRDYRWNGTAEGWAHQAYQVEGDGTAAPSGDKNMAEFLARAERARKAQPLWKGRGPGARVPSV